MLPVFWLFSSALASLEHEAPASGIYIKNIRAARYTAWSTSAYLGMAWLGVIWYCFVWLVCLIGCLQMSVSTHYLSVWCYAGSNNYTAPTVGEDIRIGP